VNSNSLEKFYQVWSGNSENVIHYINEAAIRKIEAIFEGMPDILALEIKTMIDFGCGYGRALHCCAEKLGVEKAYGFDYSGMAIEYAVNNFGSDKIQYNQLETLETEENIRKIQSVVGGGKVDCILLIDLLEHVPDCKKLITELSKITNYFIIKLPVEESILNNYLIRKVYPSSNHYNGHLREFNANSVHYFIRVLGLTPISEGLYAYDVRDSNPVTARQSSLLRNVAKKMLQVSLGLFSVILPKKIFIRLFGNGGYYCVATFKSEHILNPY